MEVRDRGRKILTLLLLQWDGYALLTWQMNPAHSYGHFHRVFGDSAGLPFHGKCFFFKTVCLLDLQLLLQPIHSFIFPCWGLLAESILRHPWINISIMGLSPAHRLLLLWSALWSALWSVLSRHKSEFCHHSQLWLFQAWVSHLQEVCTKPLNSWGYWVAPLHPSPVWASEWRS